MAAMAATPWRQVAVVGTCHVPRTPSSDIRNARSFFPTRIKMESDGSGSAVFASRIGTTTSLRAGTTLRELCHRRVPDHVLSRAEEIGYVMPTEVQEQSLPLLLSGCDCVLHAQTGSGKTLAYLLSIFSAINYERSAVQALIVVPTRELGMQVTKVARMLAAMPMGEEKTQRSCTVMTLLDGGMLKRQKSWLKAEPPEIVVATIGSLSQMLERRVFGLESLSVLVVDEVDFIFSSSKQVQALRKLLTSHSAVSSRQTIFASASIPQHHRFLYDCVQQKWTKRDVVHVHVNPVEPMPSHLRHKFLMCSKAERPLALLALVEADKPKSCIVFVSDQSAKSKRDGDTPSTVRLIEFLEASYAGPLDLILLEDNMNFNARAALFSELRQKGCLLVSTDIASRGFDLPQTTHVYNFDLPKTAIHYLHRAGRTGRLPFSKDTCSVTTLLSPEEWFVLQRFQNELAFVSEELAMPTSSCQPDSNSNSRN